MIKFLWSKYDFCIHLLCLMMALWNECESVINGKLKNIFIFSTLLTVSFLTGSLFLEYFLCMCMVAMLYISQSFFQAKQRFIYFFYLICFIIKSNLGIISAQDIECLLFIYDLCKVFAYNF